MAEARLIQEKVRDYLQSKLPQARDLALSNFVQAAGGWSHEIYVFDAHWNEDGQALGRGFCLRKDPGAGLLRELSDLKQQFLVIKALEPTLAPTPKAYWYEADPSLLDGPFFRDGKSGGRSTQSMVTCRQAVLRRCRQTWQVAGQLCRSPGLVA
jgi:aminoglycoside phosphotransferase (APT) family kinase protein